MASRLTNAKTIGVRYCGPIPQTRISELYAGLDVLSILLPPSRYLTAGKIYDYMASGRPIVGVHDPRNHTSVVLERYPLFFPVREVDAESIRDALVAAARAARLQTKGQYEACRAEALRHTWDHTLAPVADEMELLAR